jgi:hypothetical protein
MHDIHGGYIPIHIRHEVDFLKHSFFGITKLWCTIVTFVMRYFYVIYADTGHMIVYTCAYNSVYDFMHKVVLQYIFIIDFSVIAFISL